MLKANIRAPKTRSGNATKMAQFHKRARAGMRGFELHWTSTEPFVDSSDVQNVHIWHANPTQRLICADMWNRCQKWIVETEFQWLIVMKIIIETEKRGYAITECEFQYTCSLRGPKSKTLNDAMEKEFNETIAGNNAYPVGHKNKGKYLRCEFIAKVAGV